MMLRCFAASAAVIASVALPSGGAMAFDRGCGDRAVACYEKVRTPDVYATVERKVLVSPGYKEVVTRPAVYGMRAERVLVAPGRVSTIKEPAVYGTRLKSVLVKPAGVSYENVPAVVKTVRERVAVGGGSYRWEYRRDLFGRERMCKVRTATQTRTVEKQVVVSPAQRIRHVAPAVYKEVPERVVVRAASTRRVYSPAVTALVHRKVLLKAAEQRMVSHPPVVGTTHERVKVRDGGHAWRASHRHGLFGH